MIIYGIGYSYDSYVWLYMSESRKSLDSYPCPIFMFILYTLFYLSFIGFVACIKYMYGKFMFLLSHCLLWLLCPIHCPFSFRKIVMSEHLSLISVIIGIVWFVFVLLSHLSLYSVQTVYLASWYIFILAFHQFQLVSILVYLLLFNYISHLVSNNHFGCIFQVFVYIAIDTDRYSPKKKYARLFLFDIFLFCIVYYRCCEVTL